MAKKSMNYRTLDSLTPVRKVINEVAQALNNPTKTIKGSAIENVLVGVAGATAAIGAGIGFATLFGMGTVSIIGIPTVIAAASTVVATGGAIGLGVIAAPAIIVGGIGVGIGLKKIQKKLALEKENLYKDALEQHTPLLKELDNKAKLSFDRFEYLNVLNILLCRIIDELKADLQTQKQ